MNLTTASAKLRWRAIGDTVTTVVDELPPYRPGFTVGSIQGVRSTHRRRGRLAKASLAGREEILVLVVPRTKLKANLSVPL